MSETGWLILALVAGAVIGVVVGLIAGRAGKQAQLATSTADAERLRADAASARTDVARAQTELAEAQAVAARAEATAADWRAQAEEAKARLAEAQAATATAQAQRDAAAERLKDSLADRETMVTQFKALSAETLQQQSKQAEATATERLKRTEEVLTPVKDHLTKLDERLGQLDKDRSAMSAELRTQVANVVTTSESLRRETNLLSTALRRPQARGAWGELQLKRVVEVAGMVEKVDFLQQETTHTSADRQIRPDMKVLLGDDKFCYVDSKMPLEAFLDAQDATDEAERTADLRRFAANVKAHIDQLSAKDYWKADLGSPEFVVLFIPSEMLASEALAQEPDLLEYAAKKNVILATPTSLIGLLRAVAYGWKQAALADAAAEVSTLGRELYDRLGRLGAVFDKLGRSLGSSVKSYNEAVGSLEGRVLVTARKLNELQVTDAKLDAVTPVEETPRVISARELIEDATQVTPMIGRTPTWLTEAGATDDSTAAAAAAVAAGTTGEHQGQDATAEADATDGPSNPDSDAGPTMPPFVAGQAQ